MKKKKKVLLRNITETKYTRESKIDKNCAHYKNNNNNIARSKLSDKEKEKKKQQQQEQEQEQQITNTQQRSDTNSMA